jgi:hypothetical protein
MFFRRTWLSRLVTLVLLVVAYFVVLPDDLQRVIGTVLSPVREVLSLSHSVAPGLYAVIAVAIAAWAAIRIWAPLGRGRAVP